MMEAKLLVVGGSECEQEEFVLSLPAIIGRGRENQITLAHQLVSRLHCEIFESDGCVWVRDLGSLNGTYVGSKQIEGNHRLEAGDLLTVGIVTFRLVVPQSKGADGAETGLRIESVLDGDPSSEAGENDTRLASGDWRSSFVDDKSETLRKDESSSVAPRRAK